MRGATFYQRASFARSALVNVRGGNLPLRQVVKRHIRDVQLGLWPAPCAWPSSWSMTARRAYQSLRPRDEESRIDVVLRASVQVVYALCPRVALLWITRMQR